MLASSKESTSMHRFRRRRVICLLTYLPWKSLLAIFHICLRFFIDTRPSLAILVEFPATSMWRGLLQGAHCERKAQDTPSWRSTSTSSHAAFFVRSARTRFCWSLNSQRPTLYAASRFTKGDLCSVVDFYLQWKLLQPSNCSLVLTKWDDFTTVLHLSLQLPVCHCAEV